MTQQTVLCVHIVSELQRFINCPLDSAMTCTLYTLSVLLCQCKSDAVFQHPVTHAKHAALAWCACDFSDVLLPWGLALPITSAF